MGSHNSICNLFTTASERILGACLLQIINPYLILVLQAYIILAVDKYSLLQLVFSGFVLLLPSSLISRNCEIFQRKLEENSFIDM